MYTYTPDRKSKIEKVIKAFEPYIFQIRYNKLRKLKKT